jgi:hypothetical protein
MIRFIDLGNQLEDDEKAFAFFNTVTDRFLTIEGEQVFYSLEDFQVNVKLLACHGDSTLANRCRAAIPEDYLK